MKFKEITNLNKEQLAKSLEDLRVEYLKLKSKVSLNQEKKTHKLNALRKDIARVLTALNKQN